jgi:drug/metabolite transporter (DMT)-like permease
MRFYVYAASSALLFGSWPNVTKLGQASAPWTAAVVMSISALVGWITVFLSQSPTPTKHAIWLLVVAGLMNGVGTVLYSQGFSLTPSATLITVLVTLGVTVVAPLSEASLHSSSFMAYFTLKRCCGILLAVTAAPLVVRLMR